MNAAELSKQLSGAVREHSKDRRAAQVAQAFAHGQKDSIGRREYAERRGEMFAPIYGEQIKSNAYTDPKLAAAYVRGFEQAQA